MTEHMIFFVMAFGPAFLACCGILWLSVSWTTYRRKQLEHKEFKRAVTVGLLLLAPVVIQLIAMLVAKLIVMQR